MSGPSGVLGRLDAALAAFGLSCRGVMRFGEQDAALRLTDGRSVTAVVLIGVVGAAMWPVFDAWRATQVDRGGSDPLDRWSKIVIDGVAEEIGAVACYPSEAPYQPFQAWAMKAEGLKASPLGILIHPRYGLWHSYRGALLFRDWDEEVEAPVAFTHPCDRCLEKPCLSSCPVDAIRPSGFDVVGCRQYLAGPVGQRGCMISGCQARSACPVGAEYRYPPEQLRFHMQALTLPT
ncbi:MAG: ferredoxin [Allorhizobium sp.]|uniref:ferredoxin n=1 Tax=Allorhizobium sp. TaxID=633478 RepID=UPI004034D2FA